MTSHPCLPVLWCSSPCMSFNWIMHTIDKCQWRRARWVVHLILPRKSKVKSVFVRCTCMANINITTCWHSSGWYVSKEEWSPKHCYNGVANIDKVSRWDIKFLPPSTFMTCWLAPNPRPPSSGDLVRFILIVDVLVGNFISPCWMSSVSVIAFTSWRN